MRLTPIRVNSSHTAARTMLRDSTTPRADPAVTAATSANSTTDIVIRSPLHSRRRLPGPHAFELATRHVPLRHEQTRQYAEHEDHRADSQHPPHTSLDLGRHV